MIIIDPLKNRLFRSLKEGNSNPRHQALNGFGSKEDIQYLNNMMDFVIKKKLCDGTRNYVFIDIIPPFVNFVNQSGIIQTLLSQQKIVPVIMIREGKLLNWIKQKYKNGELPLVIAEFNQEGYFKEFFGGANQSANLLENIRKEISGFNEDYEKISLVDIRKRAAQTNLFHCLQKSNCVEFPYYSGNKEIDHDIRPLMGKLYRANQSGMLVSCYLNVKLFALDPEILFDAVYEIFYNLEDYFIHTEPNSEKFSCIITTNNTSVVFASILQAIYDDKKLIPIDKLGPIPSLKLHSNTLRELLQFKKVILLEEIVGTGSEVDRGIMFLNHMQSKICRIIALYDLQVGKSLIVNDSFNYVSLCTPKKELKYEYRSE